MKRFVIEFVNIPFKKETLNVYISLMDFCELFSLVVTVCFSLLCKLTVSVTKHVKGKVGPEWPRGFQEVKVPRFRDSGTGWW